MPEFDPTKPIQLDRTAATVPSAIHKVRDPLTPFAVGIDPALVMPEHRPLGQGYAVGESGPAKPATQNIVSRRGALVVVGVAALGLAATAYGLHNALSTSPTTGHETKKTFEWELVRQVARDFEQATVAGAQALLPEGLTGMVPPTSNGEYASMFEIPDDPQQPHVPANTQGYRKHANLLFSDDKEGTGEANLVLLNQLTNEDNPTAFHQTYARYRIDAPEVVDEIRSGRAVWADLRNLLTGEQRGNLKLLQVGSYCALPKNIRRDRYQGAAEINLYVDSVSTCRTRADGKNSSASELSSGQQGAEEQAAEVIKTLQADMVWLTTQ